MADQVVAYGPHPSHYAILTTPTGASNGTTVVLLHGGRWRDIWRLDLMYPMAAALAADGFAVWNVEYRRSGFSGGGVPQTLHDVAAAIDYLVTAPMKDAGVRPDRVAVVGHSAGGHLALWQAGRPEAQVRPAVTVALAPMTSPAQSILDGISVDATVDFHGGLPREVPGAYATSEPNLAGRHGQVVCLHGDADVDVPLSQSTVVAAASGVEVVVIDDTDHMQIIDPAAPCWPVVRGHIGRQ